MHACTCVLAVNVIVWTGRRVNIVLSWETVRIHCLFSTCTLHTAEEGRVTCSPLLAFGLLAQPCRKAAATLFASGGGYHLRVRLQRSTPSARRRPDAKVLTTHHPVHALRWCTRTSREPCSSGAMRIKRCRSIHAGERSRKERSSESPFSDYWYTSKKYRTYTDRFFTTRGTHLY
jgi:hypothetical protein